MIDTSFLGKLKKFRLILDRKVNSNYQGERRSGAAGAGILLKDYIQYTPGDDFRRIDWRVYARTEKLYARRYEEERNLTVHVLIDYSGSMNYGSKLRKSEYASMLGVGFAYIAMGNNERFVMSTFAEQLERFRPRRGQQQLASMVEYLNTKKATGQTNFGAALLQYHKKQINSRSIIYIMSDFLYDLDQIKQVLARYKDHKVILVQVLDKREVDLNYEGDYQLIDSETKAQMKTHISPMLRQSYQSAMADHQAKIKYACDETGAKFFDVSTGDDIFDSFYKILA